MRKYIVRIALRDGSTEDILILAKNEYDRNKKALQEEGVLFILDAKEVSG